MADWRDVGEIPDSEDDEGFDSEEFDERAVQATEQNNPAFASTTDIWDFPGSQASEPNPISQGHYHRQDNTVSSSSSSSSLLSSIGTDDDLPPVNEFFLAHVSDGNTISSDLGDLGTQWRDNDCPGLTNRRQTGNPAFPQGSQSEDKHVALPEIENSDDVNADTETWQENIRYERSLRPRKPIQEHPYLLENAQYSSFLKMHGVKPLRMAAGAERPKRFDQSLDEDFQEDSQESSVLPDRHDGSLANDLPGRVTEQDPFDGPSSTPPRISQNSSRIGASSPPSSPGGTEDTSILDQDLPALEDLLNRPSGVVTPRTKKGNTSPIRLSARKRRLMNVVGSDPIEVPQPKPRSMPLPKTPLSPARSGGVRTGVNEDELSDLAVNHFVSHAQGTTNHEVQLTKVIDFTSEYGETTDQNYPSRATSDDSQSENDFAAEGEAVNNMSRRIRGVLPASWLRLDQQAGLAKAKMTAKRRNRRYRSPDREHRRGVAQPRLALPGATQMTILYDESEDETSKVSGETVYDNVDEENTTLAYGQALHLARDGDADNYIIEDDPIDMMMPARSNRKRQRQLSGVVYGETTKKSKLSPTDTLAPRQSKPRQTRIIGHLSQSEDHRSSTDSPAKRRKTDVFLTEKRKSIAGMSTSRSRKQTPPRLSILDIIESDAPCFLKIAARTAKRRSGQGRLSPRQKRIQLATRQDQIDVAATLRLWKAGSISQRQSVTSAMKRANKPEMKQPSRERSGNGCCSPKASKTLDGQTRKFVKQISDGGSPRYLVKAKFQSTGQKTRRPPNEHGQLKPAGHIRPAQLETDEVEQAQRRVFHSRKRFLDKLYRNWRPDATAGESRVIAPLVGAESNVANIEHVEAQSQSQAHDADNADSTDRNRQKSRFKKRKLPTRVDVFDPQYSRANDPVPEVYSAEIPPAERDASESKLLGLGPYGTWYTHHFETFPLNPGVYFHESTIIGSGVLASCTKEGSPRDLGISRPCLSFRMGNEILRWGPWNDQVSSELGVLLDFVVERLDGHEHNSVIYDVSRAVEATSFILNYVKDAVHFEEEDRALPFVRRILECFDNFNGRTLSIARDFNYEDVRKIASVSKLYDRLLLATLLVLRLCRGDAALMSEQFGVEELLKRMGATVIDALAITDMEDVREPCARLASVRVREAGIREDLTSIHSWVVLMHVFDSARIPRASFWDMVEQSSNISKGLSTTDFQQLEAVWKNLFSLLPLTEFNAAGIIIAGTRHAAIQDGWGLPQKLLKQVFQVYQRNPRQGPSFNNYCRALLGRCHYLVQEWGWRRCVSLIGLIFDFFGSQQLANLRNEEVYKSPRFLEHLESRPSLNIESEDRCFHVFLKLVALVISKLKDVGSTKDMANLVARIIPNHNRQHLRGQNVHARDLAALRNHHDLLCTLFWAAPADLRPSPTLIQNLVVPASSHKEACLINIRAWSQLARFVVASGEVTTNFKPFRSWRNAFFLQVIQQFNSVASEVALQLSTLGKSVSHTISKEMIDATISINKGSVMDVIYASCAVSLDGVKNAPDLEAAIFSVNTSQLQTVFKQFSVAPPELDWGILRTSLATLESFLSKIDDFKANAGSQQSESQILNSAQADDALVMLDHELSQSFFSMARCFLSPRKSRNIYTSAKLDRDDCAEQIVTLSARITSRFINIGLIQLSKLFEKSKYQLFTGQPCGLDVDRRQYLVLFVATLLRHGMDDFSTANFSLSELWALSLVKPRNSLRYELLLGEQLRREGKAFVPETLLGLTTLPDYGTNRDLFEFAISSMRKSIRNAGPTLHRILVSEHAGTLKMVMEQIKSDLRLMLAKPSDHLEYVTFIQGVMSLIKAHGSEFCAVDNFFYQISKEYSPSIEDPQLQAASLTAYGLRLEDGDCRSGQQFFFVLFNNAKFSINSGKLGEEVSMIARGMTNHGVMKFILGKMLPAIICASFTESYAYPLLDVYTEALLLRFTNHVASYELQEDDLPAAVSLVGTILENLLHLHRSAGSLADVHVHCIRQVFASISVLWPSFRVLSVTGSTSSCWMELDKMLSQLWDFASVADEYLETVIRSGDALVDSGCLAANANTAQLRDWQNDRDVHTFAENIIQDVKKNWSLNEGKMVIQIPGRERIALLANAAKAANWDRVSYTPKSTTSSYIQTARHLDCKIPEELHMPKVQGAGDSATMMSSLFELPDELLLNTLLQSFPGRDHQIRSLSTLIHPAAAPCRNLVLHGTEATGKSSITERLLAKLAEQSATEPQGGGLKYAIVNAAQCITGRHLFECIVGAVAEALQWDADGGSQPNSQFQQRRCETLAQLSVSLGAMLRDPKRDPRWRFVLVLDEIDRQRDAPLTLIPALARLSEMISCLTCVFIVTAPPAGLLRSVASAHLHFPPYTKQEFVRIVAIAPPPALSGTTQQETTDLWTRFCAAVHDAFVRSASRTLPSFRQSCRALWPRFTAPVVAGTHSPKEFSKLLIAARVYFQDETLLNPSIVAVRPESTTSNAVVNGSRVSSKKAASASASTPSTTITSPAAADLTALLPIAARLLLLSAYLASHNATRHDLTLFSTYHHGRKRRRGGGYLAMSRANPRTKHRKIARKLLGAHAFVLERMMAIFEAVRGEWAPEGSAVGAAGLDGDIGMAIATLSSLRLLVRIGTGDLMDRGGKWRINVGWEAIRGIGRSIGVEVEEWLIESKKLDKLNLLCYSSGMAFFLTMPIWFWTEGLGLLKDFLQDGAVDLSNKPHAMDHGRLTVEFVFNGVFHFAQNILAFVLLSMVSPVTYSVASLIKRVFVIVLAIIWFRSPTTPVQALGIGLTVLGLYLYDRSSESNKADRKARFMTESRSGTPLLPLNDGGPRPLMNRNVVSESYFNAVSNGFSPKRSND